ncbi:unnamed protein product [Vicia faba]|uniref:Transmembrane protein n=1 Tax=Vicia faba TaxID=3906 RepID=A0AAV1ATE3_VICFA|nr:unnamed protein product [Vicia faba]
MSELSFSNTSNKTNEFSSNILSILFHSCFSIFSHPLYFFYFLFFSPYILKLLSFLSPLFITTTLLILVALLTFTPNFVNQKGGGKSSSSCSSEISVSKLCFFLSILQNFLTWFESDDKDEQIGFLDELEAYLVMFQTSIFEVDEPKSEEDSIFEEADEEFSVEASDVYEFSVEASEVLSIIEEEKKVNLDEENQVEKVEKVVVESIKEEKVLDVKSLVTLFQEYAELENVSSEKEEKEVVKPILDTMFNKVEEGKEKWNMRSGSKVKGNRDMYESKVKSGKSDEEHAFGEALKVKKSQRVDANYGSPQSNWEYSGKVIRNNDEVGSNLGSFGSMRVEKEWRRTLACKLFEERHNKGDGSEGMDMLWETYEKESDKVMKKTNAKKGKKLSEVEYNEDEEEEEEVGAKLCCLQALKFSTGKMNLGMGRPNLVKFSKALKGMGWLHNVGKNGKKNNTTK